MVNVYRHGLDRALQPLSNGARIKENGCAVGEISAFYSLRGEKMLAPAEQKNLYTKVDRKGQIYLLDFFWGDTATGGWAEHSHTGLYIRTAWQIDRVPPHMDFGRLKLADTRAVHRARHGLHHFDRFAMNLA
jgi:hypothetical protein